MHHCKKVVKAPFKTRDAIVLALLVKCLRFCDTGFADVSSSSNWHRPASVSLDLAGMEAPLVASLNDVVAR